MQKVKEGRMYFDDLLMTTNDDILLAVIHSKIIANKIKKRWNYFYIFSHFVF